MLKKSGLPIIFVQAGDFLGVGAKRYLDIALRQAARASPDSDVILLTDVERPGLPEIGQFALCDHRCAVLEFEQLYRHTSVNDFRYELFCFTRWFYVRDFVRRYGIGRFCMFDTDIMLFSPVEKFAAEFDSHLAGNWSWANVMRREALDLICDHFEAIFRDRDLLGAVASKHATTTVPRYIRWLAAFARRSRLAAIPQSCRLGAMVKKRCSTVVTPQLCDMNALWELASANSLLLNQNTLPAKGFDDNIHSSLNGFFAMDGAIKSLRIADDGVPRAKRTSDGAEVPFHFLHLQGHAKDLMEKFAWPILREAKCA